MDRKGNRERKGEHETARLREAIAEHHCRLVEMLSARQRQRQRKQVEKLQKRERVRVGVASKRQAQPSRLRDVIAEHHCVQ